MSPIMSPKRLMEIKNEISKLYEVYEILVTEWNGQLQNGRNATYPATVIVSVILQNMAFVSVNCREYSHEKSVKELYDKLSVLKALDKYLNGEYMVHFPYVEVEAIIEGFTMFEEDFEPEEDFD